MHIPIHPTILPSCIAFHHVCSTDVGDVQRRLVGERKTAASCFATTMTSATMFPLLRCHATVYSTYAHTIPVNGTGQCPGSSWYAPDV
ncbi:hypothetical protein PLICRDRAFT_303558 [Plicaturopsis crispa FD-325 SS-3]|nr:hypothetical protein PLICRDRAFT_303558 [Plicaturopsis crispa FD-325 SS-3]